MLLMTYNGPHLFFDVDIVKIIHPKELIFLKKWDVFFLNAVTHFLLCGVGLQPYSTLLASTNSCIFFILVCARWINYIPVGFIWHFLIFLSIYLWILTFLSKLLVLFNSEEQFKNAFKQVFFLLPTGVVRVL